LRSVAHAPLCSCAPVGVDIDACLFSIARLIAGALDFLGMSLTYILYSNIIPLAPNWCQQEQQKRAKYNEATKVLNELNRQSEDTHNKL